MRAAPLALITGLLPLLCIHLTYVVAASHGHVDWCVPYWDSCTSISATGRQLPEKLLFKIIMLPAAMLAIVFWWIVWEWLWQVCQRRSPAMLATGAVAGLFLMLYVVALGEGRDYQTIRRIGIILFFSLTFVGQLLFLHHCRRVMSSLTLIQRRVVNIQTALAAILLAIGMLSVILDLTYARYDDIEDAFEWVMMLFIVGQFIGHYPLWNSVNLRIRISSGQD